MCLSLGGVHQGGGCNHGRVETAQIPIYEAFAQRIEIKWQFACLISEKSAAFCLGKV